MENTVHYFQQGLWLAVIMSAPPLLIATICGVIVSLIQAVTQIQDQSLPYVVKLLAVAITMAALGRWFCSELIQLFGMAWTLIPNVGR
ncbi:type III secretion system export apparatus subunit SctS [Undibacterium sp. TS12]|uniref:type III secretion system export apparatus subunit SctS n=1 Tax=Undibacterium sp. TS12 TaxID=2908202 RepID=UPI00240A2081|nr:type III secretion system export apparatus subunit SctS [Undibacterium sp. TS12]